MAYGGERGTRRDGRRAGHDEAGGQGKRTGHAGRYQGVEQEFTEFYLANRDSCLRIVLVSTGDLERAEDMVAEAFAQAWQRWPKLRQHPAPAAWVVRTALNAGISWWRRSRREVPLEGRDPAAEADGAWPEIDRWLTAAIRRLPARQRQVLLLRVCFDLDRQATAELLGLSPATVGVHLHRALATLRGQHPQRANREAIT